MKISKNNLKRLCKNCECNPEKIGIAILRSIGYKVDRYNLSGAVYVYDKNGKTIYWDNGAYVD